MLELPSQYIFNELEIKILSFVKQKSHTSWASTVVSIVEKGLTITGNPICSAQYKSDSWHKPKFKLPE